MLGMDMLVNSLLKATGFTQDDIRQHVGEFLSLIAESRATLVAIHASQERIEQKLNQLLVAKVLDSYAPITPASSDESNAPARGDDGSAGNGTNGHYAEIAATEHEQGRNRPETL